MMRFEISSQSLLRLRCRFLFIPFLFLILVQPIKRLNDAINASIIFFLDQ